MTHPLATRFLHSLGAPDRSSGIDPDALEPVLRGLLEAARTAWPGIHLEPDLFLPFLAQRCPPGVELIEALSSLRTSELFLVCAVLEGDPAAIDALQTRYFPKMDAALAHLNAGPDLTAEVRQRLVEKLVVGVGDRRARLHGYAGRGDLQGWLCITAVREARRLLQKERRSVGDDVLLDVAAPDEDPEIRYLKQLYGREFKEAFQAAVVSLSSQERNLLRYHLVEGLSIDRIGALYQVHRATVARWIAAAREQILARTRERLLERLQVDRAIFDSILRLIRSQMDVSTCRLLRDTDPKV